MKKGDRVKSVDGAKLGKVDRIDDKENLVVIKTTKKDVLGNDYEETFNRRKDEIEKD